MRISLGCLIILLSFIYSLGAIANESVSWKFNNDVGLVESIKKVLSQESNLAEKGLTQLILNVDVNVENNKIVRKIQKVWYYADTGSIQEHGTDVIYYDDFNSTVEFNEALTITKSGNIKKVDLDNVKIIDSSSYEIFTNSKEIIIPYNGLEPGSATILVYVETVDRDKLEGNWSNIYYPQNTYSRKNFKLNVNWEKDQAVSWSSSSSFVKCIEEKNSLSCSGKNIPTAKKDHFVRWRDELGQIIITDTAQWDNIIAKTLDLINSAMDVGEIIDNLNNDLVAEATTLEDKIENIHRFVAQEIRYVSISDGSHAYTPHFISKTVENRFGDCKQKPIGDTPNYKNLKANRGHPEK